MRVFVGGPKTGSNPSAPTIINSLKMSLLGRIQFEISSFPVLHTVHRVSGIFTVEPILRKTGTGCPTILGYFPM